jgi:hypothetical protein
MATVTRVASNKEGNGEGIKAISQWDTSYVPTSEPRSEPIALVLKEDIVVHKFMHSCVPSLKLAR